MNIAFIKEENKDISSISQEDEIRNILIEAHQRTLGFLGPVKDLEALVSFGSSAVIPELGIGGMYEKYKNQITIYLDLESRHLVDNLKAEVSRCFAHEYMHAYREEKITWEGCTLLEAFITEGLAQNFEIELDPNFEGPIYATSLKEIERDSFWLQAQEILESTEFNYQEWFFGSEEENMPRWVGYNIGFWLVKKYCEKNNVKPSEVWQVDAGEFLL